MKKMASGAVTLIGLLLNGLFNGLFLILIGLVTTGEATSQSVIYWSAIFWAGSAFAPFENMNLFRSAKAGKANYFSGISQKSAVIFLLIASSLVVFSDFPKTTIAIATLTGICNAQIVKLRPIHLAAKKFNVVAAANCIEGLSRVLLLFLLQFFVEIVLFWQVAAIYLVGSSLSLLTYYAQRSNIFPVKSNPLSLAKFSFLKIGSASLLLTASAGGFPYIANFIVIADIDQIVYFFLISRSLLVFNTLALSIFPNRYRQIGEEINIKFILTISFLLLPPTYFLLLTICRILENVDSQDLQKINSKSLLIFSISIIFSAIFSLVSSANFVNGDFSIILVSGATSFVISASTLWVFSNQAWSFLLSIVIAPFTGVLVSKLMKEIFQKIN